MTAKKETVAEFLARGGSITQCPSRKPRGKRVWIDNDTHLGLRPTAPRRYLTGKRMSPNASKRVTTITEELGGDDHNLNHASGQPRRPRGRVKKNA